MKNWKKSLGIALCLGGILLIGISNYTQIQINEGKLEISTAQSQVNKGKSLFSLDPMTKKMGNVVLSGAQKQIDEGKMEINRYEEMAGRLQIIGSLMILVGLIYFVLGRKSSFGKR